MKNDIRVDMTGGSTLGVLVFLDSSTGASKTYKNRLQLDLR